LREFQLHPKPNFDKKSKTLSHLNFSATAPIN